MLRKYRALNQRERITFAIVDRSALKENRFIIPITYIKPKADRKNITDFNDIVRIIIENAPELELMYNSFMSHSAIKWRSN